MQRNAEGLGDVVESALKKTGVGKIAKSILGEDCGCSERKEKLNAMFDFNKKERCMTNEQFEAYEGFLSRGEKSIGADDQKLLLDLYNSIFKTNVKGCGSCGASVWNSRIKRIDNVYNKYKDEKKRKTSKTKNKKTASTKKGNNVGKRAIAPRK